MTAIIKKTYDLTRVARAKGRNYAEIDGIRIIFEDGRLEGWYNPGPEDPESVQNVPSGEVSA